MKMFYFNLERALSQVLFLHHRSEILNMKSNFGLFEAISQLGLVVVSSKLARVVSSITNLNSVVEQIVTDPSLNSDLPSQVWI